jgi:hypothetical protein
MTLRSFGSRGCDTEIMYVKTSWLEFYAAVAQRYLKKREKTDQPLNPPPLQVLCLS